jgi:hypothetical protein
VAIDEVEGGGGKIEDLLWRNEIDFVENNAVGKR